MPRTTKAGAIFGQLTEKELKEYAQFFEKNQLESMEIMENGVTFVLEQEGPQSTPIVSAPVVAGPPSKEAAVPEESAPVEAKKPVSEFKEVKSPIIGTFYSSPSPDAKAFVQAGASVSVDTSVCIIEAMKVMNEIKAGVTGKVVETLVKDGEVVQVGQVLFHVE